MSIEARLREKRIETADVHTFVFSPAREIPYRPGQYMVMDLGVGQDPRSRMHPFSIASSPTEKGILMVSTRIVSRLASSDFKRHLNALEPGDKVTIRAPFGRFILQEDLQKEAVILSGGIGITPIRSMIKYATDRQLNFEVTLLFSNRTPEDIPFQNELNLFAKLNSHLTVIYTITHREDSRQHWTGYTFRIDETTIRRFVPEPLNAIYYASGPPPMVEGLLGILARLGISPENIRSERFDGYE